MGKYAHSYERERERECVCVCVRVCFLGVVFSYGICIHGMFVIVAAATEDQNYCNQKVLCNNNTISLECPKRAAWNLRMNFQCHQVLLEFFVSNWSQVLENGNGPFDYHLLHFLLYQTCCCGNVSLTLSLT